MPIPKKNMAKTAKTVKFAEAAKTAKTEKTARAANPRMPKSSHHCPVCHQIPTARCEKKGHVVRCKIHPEHLYGTRYECGTCLEADKRKIEQDRRERREQKEREQEEAAEVNAVQKVRKKDRRPDKMKKPQNGQC